MSAIYWAETGWRLGGDWDETGRRLGDTGWEAGQGGGEGDGSDRGADGVNETKQG